MVGIKEVSLRIFLTLALPITPCAPRSSLSARSNSNLVLVLIWLYLRRPTMALLHLPSLLLCCHASELPQCCLSFASVLFLLLPLVCCASLSYLPSHRLSSSVALSFFFILWPPSFGHLLVSFCFLFDFVHLLLPPSPHSHGAAAPRMVFCTVGSAFRDMLLHVKSKSCQSSIFSHSNIHIASCSVCIAVQIPYARTVGTPPSLSLSLSLSSAHSYLGDLVEIAPSLSPALILTLEI